jgi:hypothetical protein
MGATLATFQGVESLGFMVIPIAGASAPVLIGSAAVAGVVGAGTLAYEGYKSAISSYNENRAKLYPDMV